MSLLFFKCNVMMHPHALIMLFLCFYKEINVLLHRISYLSAQFCQNCDLVFLWILRNRDSLRSCITWRTGVDCTCPFVWQSWSNTYASAVGQGREEAVKSTHYVRRNCTPNMCFIYCFKYAFHSLCIHLLCCQLIDVVHRNMCCTILTILYQSGNII